MMDGAMIGGQQQMQMAPMPNTMMQAPVQKKTNYEQMAKSHLSQEIYCELCNTDTRTDTAFTVSPIQWKLCCALGICAPCCCGCLVPFLWEEWEHLWSCAHTCRNCKKVLHTVEGNFSNHLG